MLGNGLNKLAKKCFGALNVLLEEYKFLRDIIFMDFHLDFIVAWLSMFSKMGLCYR